jgi:hypothetical protein
MASLPSQPHTEAPAGTALGRSLQKLVSRVEAAVERLPIELVLGVYAALIIARFPLLVYDPRLWAEEGFVYFMHAVREPWLTALLSEHVSYYALWPNLSGVLATLVPSFFRRWSWPTAAPPCFRRSSTAPWPWPPSCSRSRPAKSG